MNVSDAVNQRSSIRSFLKTPVSNKLIKSLLTKSSRSASGGNLQPWKIFVINKASMKDFLSFQERWDKPETPAYDIYPPKLKEPYRTSRFELGEQMYKILGIPREDKEARVAQVMKILISLARHVPFCFVDRQMGPPQWSDLGMFLQTFMLLAKEEGLDTCAQEAWSIKMIVFQNLLKQILRIYYFVACIGYRDKNDPINSLRSKEGL